MIGNPLKRRTVRAMVRRWEGDLARLAHVYGDYDSDDFSNGAEMQRNLGTAIEAAHLELTKLTAQTSATGRTDG